MSKKNFVETDLMTITEAAAYLQVHPRTIARWRDQRRVPYIAMPGGMTRFRRQDLDQWLKARSRSGKR